MDLIVFCLIVLLGICFFPFFSSICEEEGFNGAFSFVYEWVRIIPSHLAIYSSVKFRQYVKSIRLFASILSVQDDRQRAIQQWPEVGAQKSGSKQILEDGRRGMQSIDVSRQQNGQVGSIYAKSSANTHHNPTRWGNSCETQTADSRLATTEEDILAENSYLNCNS